MRTFLLMLLLCLMPTTANAAEPVGRWAGGFEFAGQELTLILDIERDKGRLSARWSVPERDIVAVPAELEIDGEAIRLTLDQPGLAVGTMTAQLADDFLRGEAAFEPMGTGRVMEGRFLLARMARLDLTALKALAGDYQVTGLGLLQLEAVEAPFGPSFYAFAPARGDEGAITYPVGESEFIIGLDPGDEQPIAVRFTLDGGSGRILVEIGGRQVEGTRQLCETQLNSAELNSMIEAMVGELHIPGAAVGIVEDGRLIYTHYAGLRAAGGEAPVDADTLFQIGSVSKTFAAALLAGLELDGIVREGDPVATYLGKKEQFASIDPGLAARISLGALATHRSGLPRDPFNLRREDGRQLAYDLDDLAAANRAVRLAAEPGARFTYSNYGYGLLGHALARAAGRPYAALLQDELLIPLGMTATRLGAPDRDHGAAHHRDGEPRGPWEWGEVAAQGGIASTLPDMARWVGFQLGAPGPLDPRIATMSQRLRAPRDGGNGIGLGWYLDDDPLLGHIVSHGGEVDGQSAQVSLVPLHGIGVIVLANVGGDAAERIGQAVLGQAVTAVRGQQLASPRTASALYQDRRWAEAAWAYRSLVEHAPGYTAAKLRYGLALLQGGELSEAVDAFAAITDEGRAGAMAHYYRALTLAKAGRDEEARSAFIAATHIAGEAPIRARAASEPALMRVLAELPE